MRYALTIDYIHVSPARLRLFHMAILSFDIITLSSPYVTPAKMPAIAADAAIVHAVSMLMLFLLRLHDITPLRRRHACCRRDYNEFRALLCLSHAYATFIRLRHTYAIISMILFFIIRHMLRRQRRLRQYSTIIVFHYKRVAYVHIMMFFAIAMLRHYFRHYATLFTCCWYWGFATHADIRHITPLLFRYHAAYWDAMPVIDTVRFRRLPYTPYCRYAITLLFTLLSSLTSLCHYLPAMLRFFFRLSLRYFIFIDTSAIITLPFSNHLTFSSDTYCYLSPITPLIDGAFVHAARLRLLLWRYYGDTAR